ncbi:MAG: hypothetical protein PHH77_12850 [Victivallaceae bacterium]|nr:hypothetical protein [Victivallaceae bacterium]
MKKTKRFSGERGQAIMEMCVCLIPILVVMLGMIFIAGLGISNIRALIQAKGNAETLSRSPLVTGGAGDNIQSWDYGNPKAGGDGYPFTADDKIVGCSESEDGSNTAGLIERQLNSDQDSESLSGDANSNYIFTKVSALPDLTDNLAQDIPQTMLAAADLVEGTADSNLAKVFTVTSANFSENEINRFHLSLTHLLGIKIDAVDLRNMRANTVYYPSLPTQ